jgi:predicted transcriptional regulator
MAKKTLAENAVIDFQITLEALKKITRWDDKELAEELGCTEQTIRNMRKDPLSVGGRWILLVNRHFLEAESERNGYRPYAR